MKNEDKNEDEDITEQTTEANEESTPFIINDISEIAQSESLQQESAINSIGATLETLTQSNTEQSEVQSSDSSPTKEIFENQLDSTINLNETYSNSDTDIKIQEESTTISQEDADDLIAENDNEYIKVDEDANNHAASLLLAGVKQSSLENNVTYNTVLNNSIQNNEENYVSNSINEQDLSTTTTTESLPESSTTTEMSTSTETITEINSVQERIRAYRRFSSLQRATAKPVIYAKRANVKAITRTTTSTTASPVSTTKSYLKRVAASRLRLAKLNAAHKKETNENYVESETSKKYIRNLEKETGIKTDLSNGPNPLSTAASNNEQSQAVATWESVRNNLQRYMQRKRSGQTDYGYQTATRPSTTATPTTISSRRYNIVSRNRFSNFKTQVNSRRQTSSTSTTTEIPISTAAPVTSRPPAISVTHSTSEQISTSFKTPDLSHLLNSITKGVQLQSSNTNTIPTNTFAAGLHKNTNTFTKSTSSSSTSSSPSPNLETDNFISFDKLTRAIVDESILQNFRSNQHSSKTHLVSNEVVPIAISTNKPINTDTFIDKTTSNGNIKILEI